MATDTEIDEILATYLSNSKLGDSESCSNEYLAFSSSEEGLSPDSTGNYSDKTLDYITHILMDENDKLDGLHKISAIEATEKTFYEVLGKKYPSPQDFLEIDSNTSDTTDWYDYSEYQLPLEFTGNHTFGTTNSFGIDPVWQFNKGVEGGHMFIPILDETDERGRKNPHAYDSDTNKERRAKQSHISYQETLNSAEFDEVLLCEEDKLPKSVKDIRKTLQLKTSKSPKNNAKIKKEVVDLHNLLLQCAQMVASSDQHGAKELIKRIRDHTSPQGDGSQRTSHYFVNALDARLAGTGVELYKSQTSLMQRSASDFMRAYKFHLASCPFRKVSHFFSNQTILNISEKASSLHVIDFGINFGFQWPSLIKRIASRPGGPPKLRITGIDFPQPGFRPAERVEETGRRLVDYAKNFHVPFEYRSIACKWEEVEVEDLDIHGDVDEVLVVNCLYQMKYVADETVKMDCPREKVLKTIRKMKPDVFIHGIVNGSYNAPFFLARFREALFHFSAVYDMKDMIVPREDETRSLVEREMHGRAVLNVVACEGLDRIERPENYKQWQIRNSRAGFVQHSLNQDIMKKSKEKVKKFYHKEFSVEEHKQWLLQGWKGRNIFALSSWIPNYSKSCLI